MLLMDGTCQPSLLVTLEVCAAMVRTAGPSSYVDGNGLMPRVTKRGTRQWIQRLTIHGRRVDLGLGSAELVRLADARRTAADNRAIARTGGDPRRVRVPTFAKAEEACFAEKLQTWRTGSPARNWRLAVERYVLPKLGVCPWTRWAQPQCTRCCARWRFPASTRW